MVMANLGYFRLFCNLFFSQVFVVENFLFITTTNRKLKKFFLIVRLRFELLSDYPGCHKAELRVLIFIWKSIWANKWTDILKMANWHLAKIIIIICANFLGHGCFGNL